jgi:hypothetical protein
MIMNKIVPAVSIAVIGVIVWLALKAKYQIRGVRRHFLGRWRQDSRIRETAIFSSALIVSWVIFAILPGLLL